MTCKLKTDKNVVFISHQTTRNCQLVVLLLLITPANMDANFFPFPNDVIGDDEVDSVKFGHSIYRYFDFEPGYVNVNHGSYGSLPNVINKCRRYWQDRAESCPDRFYRYELAPLLDKAVRTVAELMNVKDPEDLAFIPNASAGVNAVLRSLKLNSTNDVVLYLSEAYGAVKLIAQYAADFSNAQYLEMPIQFPFKDAELVEQLENELIKHQGRIKIVSVSHISSVPTAILPVQDIVQVCRKYKAYSVIDGAHTLGQIPLDLERMDPDFYLTNGHKWFYTPRGSGVLYVKKQLQHLIHPTVVSWNYRLGFQREFHQLGTLDYGNFLTFPTAMEFRRRLGGETKIMTYCHRTAVEGAKKLATVWNTEWSLVPEHQLGAMANVRMPINDSALIGSVVEKLFLSYKTFLAHFQERNVWYARISAQIFNEPEDYERIGRDFLDIVKYVKQQSRPESCTSKMCNCSKCDTQHNCTESNG